MLICKYKYAHTFLALSIIFVLIVYLCYKDNVVKGLHISTTLREPFVIEENLKSAVNNVRPNTIQNYNNEYQQYAKKGYNIFNKNYTSFPEQKPFQNTFNQNLLLPATKRDSEAGIQYYTPDVGTNERMFIEPLIAPRALDREVWGYPSNYPGGMNIETLYDVTQGNNFPENINNYKYAEYGQYDYRRDERPIYKNVGNWESDSSSENPMKILEEKNKKQENEEKKINIATSYAQPSDQLGKMNENLYTSNIIEKTPGNPDLVTSSTNNYEKMYNDNILKQQVGGKQNITSIKNVLSSDPRTGNYMLEPSPTYMYTDDYFNQPQKRLFLQDVQPNMYSYSVDETPINANIGITYAPQNPPKFRDQVYTNNKNYPVLTSIDPQLVRDDGLTQGQRAEQPYRDGISAKYSNWNPPAGSINFEDIYDPRFTSYGDPYRGYSDVNLGQVQYYYSDIDAYRQPNFIIRSNVDFVDYLDPNGKVKPYYERTATLEDVKDIVDNRYDADDLYHREDIMSSLMEKRNSELYQLRQAPLRKQNNGRSYTYGPY